VRVRPAERLATEPAVFVITLGPAVLLQEQFTVAGLIAWQAGELLVELSLEPIVDRRGEVGIDAHRRLPDRSDAGMITKIIIMEIRKIIEIGNNFSYHNIVAPAEALAAEAITLAVARMRRGFPNQDGRRGVVIPKVPTGRTSGMPDP
jgi:hypothetical protein